MARPADSRGSDFGVVIVATPDHLHWVRGACASVRYFMDDTPICLILDGKGRADDLNAYGVRVIPREEVAHDELRGLTFGSIKAKNAVFWLSPFETFLFLDADAVVWGDMRALADFERFDIVLGAPIHDLERVRKAVMEIEAVDRFFPDFDATSHVGDFVNSGVFFGRRGVLDLDLYLELVRFSRAHPGVLSAGSQGVLNLLIFRAADEGKLRVAHRDLQVVAGDVERDELVRRFSFANGAPRVVGPPIALHWARTPKPRVREAAGDYFEPMTYFRRRFRIAVRNGDSPRAADDVRLRLEDLACRDWRSPNLRGRSRRLRRRATRGTRRLLARARVHARRRAPRWLVAAIKSDE